MNETENASLQKLKLQIDGVEKLVKEIRALVGPFGTQFPDGSMLVQTIHGLKYFIDPNDEIMAPQLVVYRQWEADLSAYIANSMKPESIFLDIGANFGYFTCLAASRIGTQGCGSVIAIEPNPQMQILLQKNLKVNWSMAPVVVYDLAVTDKDGYVEFSVPKNRAANASLVSSMKLAGDNRFIVKANSVDNLLKDRIVDVCKIDVEGFEALVLRGATKTIARSENINIILEWSLSQMQTAGFSPEDLLSIFSAYGLSTYRLPPTRFISDSEWGNYKIGDDYLVSTGYDNILLRRPL